MAMRMTGLLAATAIAAALTAPMAAQAATNLPMPPAVASAITATASPAQIAALAVANGELAATILAAAAAVNITPQSVVAAAIAADPNTHRDIVAAATEAAPGSANAIVTAAAQAIGLTLGAGGGENDYNYAYGIANSARQGLEAAGRGDEASLKTVFAGVAAFLSPSEQQALGSELARLSRIETDSARGYMVSLQTGEVDGDGDGDVTPGTPLQQTGGTGNGGGSASPN